MPFCLFAFLSFLSFFKSVLPIHWHISKPKQHLGSPVSLGASHQPPAPSHQAQGPRLSREIKFWVAPYGSREMVHLGVVPGGADSQANALGGHERGTPEIRVHNIIWRCWCNLLHPGLLYKHKQHQEVTSQVSAPHAHPGDKHADITPNVNTGENRGFLLDLGEFTHQNHLQALHFGIRPFAMDLIIVFLQNVLDVKRTTTLYSLLQGLRCAIVYFSFRKLLQYGPCLLPTTTKC